MTNTRLTLTFSNSIEEAPRMARRIERFLHENKISESIINKLLLCVDELITNIIGHAYTDDQEHAVSLECRIFESHIELELRDDGIAFDPTSQTRPNVIKSIEDREVGGLGIHLVTTIMDRVEYVREGDYNVLKTVKVID